MRNQTPLAPGEPDVTVHIVLNDFGALGRAYVETDEAEADEATIIENILSGQYSHPVRVIAFNTAEGWAREIESVEMISLGLEDHGLRSNAVLKFAIACSRVADTALASALILFVRNTIFQFMSHCLHREVQQRL